MIKVPVYNQNAEKVSDLELNSKVFEVKPNLHLLAESVRIQQSNSRVGLANTKTRGEVSGGGKKPWKQKGTGRARAGSTRGPIWRHGGVALGPRSTRNWELKINKKAKTQALFMALSDKLANNKLVVVDKFIFEPVKTKTFVAILKTIKEKLSGEVGKKPLIVLPKADIEVVRAIRNVPSVNTSYSTKLNVVEILSADSLVVLEDSIPLIEKTYLKTPKKKTVTKD